MNDSDANVTCGPSDREIAGPQRCFPHERQPGGVLSLGMTACPICNATLPRLAREHASELGHQDRTKLLPEMMVIGSAYLSVRGEIPWGSGPPRMETT
jgi:hypothetical protein